MENKEITELRNNVVTDISSWLNEVSESVTQLAVVEPIEITLKEFETYFLPYILNLVERDEMSTMVYTRNLLDKTNDNYHTPLAVIDYDEEGEKYIRYELPPYMLGIDTKSVSDISFSGLIAMYDNIKVDNPFKARDLLKKSMEELGSIVQMDKKYVHYFRELLKINNDYEYLKTNKENNSIGKTNDVEEEEEDLFDY